MYARLNLATKPLISHRRFLAGSIALAALGFAVLLGLGWRFYVLRKADENLRARSSKIQQETEKVAAQRRELEKFFEQQQAAGFQERAKFAVGVLQARSINWTQMFMDLEKTLPPGVHVLHIEPKLEKGVVSVHFIVGANSQESKLKMLKAFENSSAFSRVQLQSERVATQAGADPLLVEFIADYTDTVHAQL
jgi:Tfp pilus assembly protein PilN